MDCAISSFVFYCTINIGLLIDSVIMEKPFQMFRLCVRLSYCTISIELFIVKIVVRRNFIITNYVL